MTKGTMSGKTGYARVAWAMATDQQFAIYRRFSHLARQDLLYRQAELVYLEREYCSCIKADASSKADWTNFLPSDWWFLRHRENSQWDKWLEIREKLNEYYDCLQRQQKITMADSPNAHDLEIVRSWMSVRTQGNYPPVGADRNSWDTDNTEDLITLSPPQAVDVFTRFLLDKVVPATHKMLTNLVRRVTGRSREEISEAGAKERGYGTRRDPNSGNYKYRLKGAELVLNIVVTVFASMFPVLSIIVLFFVHTDARLGLIAAFTTLFALALATMTQSGRQEIFAACAAFAAVQVVYVSGSGSGPSGSGSGSG